MGKGEKKLRLGRHFGEVEPVAFAVIAEGFFVFDEHGAHHGGLVSIAHIGHVIGDEMGLLVRVGEREAGFGHYKKWNLLIRALSVVLDYIGQQFELVNKVRIFRRVNLSKF